MSPSCKREPRFSIIIVASKDVFAVARLKRYWFYGKKTRAMTIRGLVPKDSSQGKHLHID